MAADEKWYFTKDQLANTPSRKCGIDADKELSYRQQAANFIQDMGQRLSVYPFFASYITLSTVLFIPLPRISPPINLFVFHLIASTYFLYFHNYFLHKHIPRPIRSYFTLSKTFKTTTRA